MRYINIYTLGSLPTFAVPTDEPGYWTERLSYELSHMLNDAAAAGMVIQQAESTDLDSMSSAVQSVVSSVGTWMDDSVLAETESQPQPSAPEVWSVLSPYIPTLISSGFNPVVVVFVMFSAGIQLYVRSNKSIRSHPGDQVGSGDVAGLREELGFIRTALYSLLGHVPGPGEDVQGLAKILFQGLIDHRVEGELVTDEAILSRILEEWEVNIEGLEMRDGKVRFQASQGVTPPEE